jgi:hypothetical protein
MAIDSDQLGVAWSEEAITGNYTRKEYFVLSRNRENYQSVT